MKRAVLIALCSTLLAVVTEAQATVQSSIRVKAQNNIIKAVNSSGQPLWEAKLAAEIIDKPITTNNLVIVAFNQFNPMRATVQAYQLRTGKLLWTKRFDSTVSMLHTSGNKVLFSRYTTGEGHYGITHVLNSVNGINLRTIVGSYENQNSQFFLIKPDVNAPYNTTTVEYVRYDAQKDQEITLRLKVSPRKDCGDVAFPPSPRPVDLKTQQQTEMSSSTQILINRVDDCGAFTTKFNWLTVR